jgi:hypothetical protein
MKLIAVIIYCLILYGSLMLGMYIKFDDAVNAVNRKKEEMANMAQGLKRGNTL